MKEALKTVELFIGGQLTRGAMTTVDENGELTPEAESVANAIKALRSYADALPDKPLPPDNFWWVRAGHPPISDRMLALYQLERPGKSLPPKHPGIILAPEDDSAIFVAIDRGKVAQVVFRNDSGFLSSALIRQAMELVWRAFPGKALFTLIDPAQTRSRYPGFVFRMAGWRYVGMTPTRVKLGANPEWFKEAK